MFAMILSQSSGVSSWVNIPCSGTCPYLHSSFICEVKKVKYFVAIRLYGGMTTYEFVDWQFNWLFINDKCVWLHVLPPPQYTTFSITMKTCERFASKVIILSEKIIVSLNQYVLKTIKGLAISFKYAEQTFKRKVSGVVFRKICFHFRPLQYN